MSRCRFCHKAGHNRNSCPDVANSIVEAKQAIAGGAEEYTLGWKHRFALQVARNKEQIAAAAAARGASNTPRKCSYCLEAGHTRAKCSNLNYDKTTLLAYETRFRNAFVRWLANGGIGVGAMMERQSEWDEHKYVIMLTKSNSFNNVTLLNPNGDSTVSGVYMNREGWEGHMNDYSIPSGTGHPFADARYGYKVVAPAPIPFEVADGYANAVTIKEFIDTLFDEKPKREYRWHRQKSNWGSFHTTRPSLAGYFDRVTAMEIAASNSEVSAA